VSGLVELARFPTRIAADLARLKLESEGIDAILFDAETAGIGWGPMMPVRLMVLDSDRWIAMKLLGEDAG
jgi:hypothetical protein